jgi:hypothetical protein
MTQTVTTQASDEPEILRVFQSKAETKVFYDKISHVYDLLAEHSEGPVRRPCNSANPACLWPSRRLPRN